MGCAVAGGRLSGTVDRKTSCDVLVGLLLDDEQAPQVDGCLLYVGLVDELHGRELVEDFV